MVKRIVSIDFHGFILIYTDSHQFYWFYLFQCKLHVRQNHFAFFMGEVKDLAKESLD